MYEWYWIYQKTKKTNNKHQSHVQFFLSLISAIISVSNKPFTFTCDQISNEKWFQFFRFIRFIYVSLCFSLNFGFISQHLNSAYVVVCRSHWIISISFFCFNFVCSLFRLVLFTCKQTCLKKKKNGSKYKEKLNLSR